MDWGKDMHHIRILVYNPFMKDYKSLMISCHSFLLWGKQTGNADSLVHTYGTKHCHQHHIAIVGKPPHTYQGRKLKLRSHRMWRALKSTFSQPRSYGDTNPGIELEITKYLTNHLVVKSRSNNHDQAPKSKNGLLSSNNNFQPLNFSKSTSTASYGA